MATLTGQKHPLASSEEQLRIINNPPAPQKPFDDALASSGLHPLAATSIQVFQINVGKLCNMTCRHCHVDAGPDRWREVMDLPTVDACLRALDTTNAHTVDITGGAPELNPHFFEA